MSHWPDEPAFHAADARRRQSPEVDLGATWRDGDAGDAYRVGWLRDTGEVYVCRADGYDGSCTDVRVLAHVASEAELDVLLEGWREARAAPDGLTWLRDRLAVQPAA